jgi:hypothetical protein
MIAIALDPKVLVANEPLPVRIALIGRIGAILGKINGCVANPIGNLVSRRSFAVIGIQIITL